MKLNGMALGKEKGTAMSRIDVYHVSLQPMET
jgi:hypothetical protein